MPVVTVCLLVWISFYVPSAGGPNCGAVGCGVTASGGPPGPAIAACGPGWALGTRLYVPGQHYGEAGYSVVCGDRFGSPPGPYAIDLYAESLPEAVAQGGQWMGPVCRVRHCPNCQEPAP